MGYLWRLTQTVPLISGLLFLGLSRALERRSDLAFLSGMGLFALLYLGLIRVRLRDLR